MSAPRPTCPCSVCGGRDVSLNAPAARFPRRSRAATSALINAARAETPKLHRFFTVPSPVFQPHLVKPEHNEGFSQNLRAPGEILKTSR